jgi:hypothetical protein
MSELGNMIYEMYIRMLYACLGAILAAIADIDSPTEPIIESFHFQKSSRTDEIWSKFSDKYINGAFYAITSAMLAGLMTFIVCSRLEHPTLIRRILVHLIIDGAAIAFSIWQVSETN